MIVLANGIGALIVFVPSCPFFPKIIFYNFRVAVSADTVFSG